MYHIDVMPDDATATARKPGRATPTPPAADPQVARWVRRLLADARPRASSLIVTVWGDALAPHGGTVWLSTLIGLVAPFGINERLVRTSVFRLARDGWLAAEAAGRRSRYRLTAAGAQRFAQAYRRVYTPPAEPWDGHWEVVLAPPDRVPSARRRPLRAELAWAGFGEFTPGTWARPARADEALARLATLLDDERALTVFVARDRGPVVAMAGGSPIGAAAPADFGATLASRAPTVWELGSLAADYRHFLARFGSVVEALRRRPDEARDPAQTFAVRTLLVHEYRRVRLRDPQLPAALLPPDWPGAAAYSLARAFYRLARPAAEAHLEGAFAAGGENLAPALPEFLLRFPDPG